MVLLIKSNEKQFVQVQEAILFQKNAWYYETGESSSYFKVYIRPDSKYLVSKEGNKVDVSNGMAVEARIQYDEVTYFDYVQEALGVLTR